MRLSLGKLDDLRLELVIHWVKKKGDPRPVCRQPVTANSSSVLADVTCKKCLRIARNEGRL